MSNRLKIKGVIGQEFDIGLTNKFTLDTSGFTANRTWVLPDSNGSNGYFLQTDGSNNLSWAGASLDSTVPYYIPTGETFVNNLYRQSLFSIAITIHGDLEVNGILVEV